MNNRQIVASLNEIANLLDDSGMYKEASDITKVMVKVSQQFKGYWPDPTFTSRSVLQYVNEAMADHNRAGQGWAALKQKIYDDPKFNKDQKTLARAWASASKIFQQKLSILL